MTTYAKLDGMLQGRNRERRKLAYATYAERRACDCGECPACKARTMCAKCGQCTRCGEHAKDCLGCSEGHIAVRLYMTDIGTFAPDGVCTLDSGGWRTQVTARRINADVFGAEYPFRLWSDGGEWYLRDYGRGKGPLVFADGMKVWPDGRVDGGLTVTEVRKRKRVAGMIKTYVNGFMRALAAGKVGAPPVGDCFYCLMRVQPDGSEGTQTGVLMPHGLLTRAAACRPATSGRTLGEQNGNTSHLKSHMEERYYVSSLLARAGEVFPVSQAAHWWLGSLWGTGAPADARDSMRWFGSAAQRQWRSSLRRYLRRQFMLAG